MKTLKNILFATLPTVFILLVILEVFFRIVIPADDPPGYIFDEREQMYYFSNKKEKGVSTKGRFAEIMAKWRINNMHWNYPIDYYPVNGKKLIAIIGDSFIEAIQVDVDKNYPYLLREKIKNDYEVYAFGISGAPLSQYLNISRYVKRHFEPDILIINLVYNDFDESIQQLKHDNLHSSFLQVSITGDGSITEIAPKPNYSFLQYKPWKRLVFKSALFRYLYLNLHIKEMRYNLLATQKDNYEANVKIDDVNINKELIFKSTNYLVKTIRDENSGQRIIFVLDALRGNIYDNTLDKSKVLWISEMMASICANNKVEYIDLTPLMQQDFKNRNKKFNFEKIDGHWNEYGHMFVANVLYEYLKNNKN